MDEKNCIFIEASSMYGIDDWWLGKANRRRKKLRVYECEGKKIRKVRVLDEDEIRKENLEEGIYGKLVVEERDMRKVLVVDDNIGLEHARGIGRDGYEVYYGISSRSPYPRMQDEINGYGFPEIKKVDDWGEGLERGCGVIVFTDIGNGRLIDFLRRKGYCVFGSDARSERLETDRIYMRKMMGKLGISVPRGRVISGIDRLLKFIDKNKGEWYVKVNRVRGDFETMLAEYKEELLVALSKGAFTILGDEVKFVVEKPCDGIEIGCDFFFNGEEVVSPVFETIEVKGMGNVTKVVDVDDSVWRKVLERVTPFLERNNYCGMIGVEGFYNGDDIVVIDWSMRYPYICSHAYPVIIENYGDVVTGVACSEYIDVDVKCKYSVQIGVYTDNVHDWRIIRYRNGKNWEIGFRKAIVKDGNVWYVPGDSVLAVSVGYGNDLDVAMDGAISGSNVVETREIYSQGEELRRKIDEVLEKAGDLGYDF